MSEASIRTIAWRDQKRQEGYQPVTIWIPAAVKNAMVNLSFQRHQDLGELITQAFPAWTPAKAAGAGGVLTPAQVATLIDRLERVEALASQLTPAVPVPPPPPAPQPAHLPHPPVGTAQCRKGHAPYPATKAECPQCVRERKRAYRKRQAEKRRGEVPA